MPAQECRIAGRWRWSTLSATHVGGFHGPQVCGLVGISYRQLDYWARTGLLQPSVAAAKGSGIAPRLLVLGRARAQGHQAAARRRASRCSRPAGPSSACARISGADLASANLVLTGTQLGAGPLQRRGRRPAGRRPGRVQHRAAGRRGRGARRRHRPPRRGDGRRRHAAERPARRRLRGPPGSDHDGPCARRAHTPSGLCARRARSRFAHPSDALFAALLDLSGERWEYEPVEFPLEWDEHGHADRRASGPTSTCPTAASSSS